MLKGMNYLHAKSGQYSLSINFFLRPYTAFSICLIGGLDFSGVGRERRAGKRGGEEEENMASNLSCYQTMIYENEILTFFSNLQNYLSPIIIIILEF